ncbi:MAG: hypothetical protein HRT89_13420 [Lentisphaeria bacterium]|nr:hypothetical protein [Lentisphaeria bacterium]NQZ69057.1 hypothetical protein [Lentisphaeria bacterium]
MSESFAKTEKDPKPGTVIFIHGFMRKASSHWAMDKHFTNRGYRTLNWSYESRKYKIEEHALHLLNEVTALSKKYPLQKIHFVTHSMGGLVLRSLLANKACPIEALYGAAVMTVAPNQGSIMARKLKHIKIARLIFGDQAGKQLIETEEGKFDELLGALPDTKKYLIIAGTCGANPFIPGRDDGKVAVEETRLEVEHEFATVFAGHSWLTWTPKAMSLAYNFIEENNGY